MTNDISFDNASKMLESLMAPPKDRRNITKIAPVMIDVLGAMREMVPFYRRCDGVSEHLDEMLDLCRAIVFGGDSAPQGWTQQAVSSRGLYITQYPVYAALDHLSQRSNVSVPRLKQTTHVNLTIPGGRPNTPAQEDH